MANDRTPPLEKGARVAITHTGEEGPGSLSPAIVLNIYQHAASPSFWFADFRSEHGDERGRLVDYNAVVFPDSISDEDRERWASIWYRLEAPDWKPPTGVEWDIHGHYETADGDRVSLFERDGRWALSYSYVAPHSGQFIDYGQDKNTALRLFRLGRRTAKERGPLSYDRADCFALGGAPCGRGACASKV
ncbi:hypothetical protein ACK1X7_07420 [Streptomyces sp. CY1]|uniref:hypothetical protein n=1 Tax=Streptomyces sp. CY1 TaxID=3388313 RepID=UPI0039A026E8